MSKFVSHNRHIDWVLGRVDFLLSSRVIPVLVFDGGRLPMKSETELKRRQQRVEAQKMAEQLLSAGHKTAALKYFQKSIQITNEMIQLVIEGCKKRSVEYIIAPYEADAQLCYLSLNNYINAVISEDSDLIVFGCKRILFKLDKDGTCEEIRLKNLSTCDKLNMYCPITGIDNQSLLQQMCILSGCDYLESIPGIGLRTAYQLIRQFRNYSTVIRHLKFSGKYKVPSNYEMEFEKAILTFRHQRVYDPIGKTLKFLTPIEDTLSVELSQKFDCLDFIGADLPRDIAVDIAEARLHPTNYTPYDKITNTTSSSKQRVQSVQEQLIQNTMTIQSSQSQRSCDALLQNNSSSPFSHTTRPDNKVFFSINELRSNPAITSFSTKVSVKAKNAFIPPRNINQNTAMKCVQAKTVAYSTSINHSKSDPNQSESVASRVLRSSSDLSDVIESFAYRPRSNQLPSQTLLRRASNSSKDAASPNCQSVDLSHQSTVETHINDQIDSAPTIADQDVNNTDFDVNEDLLLNSSYSQSRKNFVIATCKCSSEAAPEVDSAEGEDTGDSLPPIVETCQFFGQTLERLPISLSDKLHSHSDHPSASRSLLDYRHDKENVQYHDGTIQSVREVRRHGSDSEPIVRSFEKSPSQSDKEGDSCHHPEKFQPFDSFVDNQFSGDGQNDSTLFTHSSPPNIWTHSRTRVGAVVLQKAKQFGQVKFELYKYKPTQNFVKGSDQLRFTPVKSKSNVVKTKKYAIGFSKLFRSNLITKQRQGNRRCHTTNQLGSKKDFIDLT